MELRTMNEGWELLPTLDENIEMRWIMGGKDEASDLCVVVLLLSCIAAMLIMPFFSVGGPENARITVWRREKNASNVRIPGAGHLVCISCVMSIGTKQKFIRLLEFQTVQEKPKEFGE